MANEAHSYVISHIYIFRVKLRILLPGKLKVSMAAPKIHVSVCFIITIYLVMVLTAIFTFYNLINISVILLFFS
jgi:hypothetical protein